MLTRLSGATVAAAMVDVEWDPTYGHTLDSLLTFGPPDTEPTDFDAFWAEVRAEALAVDPAPSIGPWQPADEQTEVAQIKVTGLDGVRLGGWLVRSRGETTRGLVIGHGYGGRLEPGLELPPGVLSIQLVARGMVGSEHPGIGTASREHVLSGIGSARTYSHVGSAADQWTATTVLATLAPGLPIGYSGGSFGGGIGALAAGVEDRWDGVCLGVPSFGHHPVRLSLPSRGSGEAVREHHGKHPEVSEVLRYVDAATMATRITVPALITPALADPAVPPPGQFAVAQSMQGPTWLHVRSGGHGSWPGDTEEMAEINLAAREFWADPVAATGS